MALRMERLTTLDDIQKVCPGLRKNTVRWWIDSNKRDFSTRCCIRVDGRLLVDLDEAAKWVDEWRMTEDTAPWKVWEHVTSPIVNHAAVLAAGV